MTWRRITVDGSVYKWGAGKASVVIQIGPRWKVITGAHAVKGISVEAYERGKRKKTRDGMVTSREVATYIREYLKLVLED